MRTFGVLSLEGSWEFMTINSNLEFLELKKPPLEPRIFQVIVRAKSSPLGYNL